MSHATWRDPKYLLDMLLAARDAESVVVDLTREQFEQNRTAQLAAAHALQIIGEAAGRVSRQTQELHPELPWRQMIGIAKPPGARLWPHRSGHHPGCDTAACSRATCRAPAADTT
jgi:DNA-binding transcriptional regulator YdaS (Cro superfamily)